MTLEASVAHASGTGNLYQARCHRGHALQCLKFGCEVMPGPWRVWGWWRPDSQARGQCELRDGGHSGRLFSSGVWPPRRTRRCTDF